MKLKDIAIVVLMIAVVALLYVASASNANANGLFDTESVAELRPVAKYYAQGTGERIYVYDLKKEGLRCVAMSGTREAGLACVPLKDVK